MEIQPADPRARRLAIVVLIAAVIAGSALLLLFDRARPLLAAWILADSDSVAFRARVVLGVVALFVVAPLIAFAAYFYQLGTLTVSSARFPPPGTPMMQDTIVLTGDPARTRGRVLKVIAVTVFLGAFGMALLLWMLGARAVR
jgi:hypothetical protein